MILGRKLRSLEGGRVAFMCPGCNELHQVRVVLPMDERGNDLPDGGPLWGYNCNPDAPTFSPSILVSWSEPSDIEGEFDDPVKDRKMICHSVVTDGRIQFLGDCTHALAGQTVELPDLEVEA